MPHAWDRFIADPARYISRDQVHHEPAVTPTDAGETLWTCPMHPQIIRTDAGFCPICGMALEPMTQPGRRPKARAGFAVFGRKATGGEPTCNPLQFDRDCSNLL
jgi:Heavy metal binding domain